MATQTYRFMWQGIEIEAVFTPLNWGVVAHLEIRSTHPEAAPLPITSTGYLSYFHQPGTMEALGGDVVGYVAAWLNDEAGKPKWQQHREKTRQGDLFG